MSDYLEFCRELMNIKPKEKCSHRNYNLSQDPDWIQIHNSERLTIKIVCPDCGAVGWEWFKFIDTEWE